MTGNVAVCHWAERVNGGGERVGWELARAFDTSLYVAERSPEIEPEDVEVQDVFEGRPVERLVKRSGAIGDLAHQAGWSTAWRLRDHDALVTSGNECLAYVPGDGQPWVHYVHHTSRQATDRLPTEGDQHDGGLLPRKTTAWVDYLQRWVERQIYSRYAGKPDRIVCNSPIVADRVQTYWGVHPDHIDVVMPPVPTETYGPDYAATEDVYLTLSRLDGHKCIEDILRAFEQLQRDDAATYTLLVAGDGSERDRLEDMAPENVTFLGYVDEERKRHLLSRAKAFVFAADHEDFGLVTAEALASGTPVIGVKEGMTQHQVHHNRNGLTWAREGGHLREAIRRFERDGVTWSEEEIAAEAARYGRERFRRRMRDIVEETITAKRERRTPDWVPVEEPPTPEPEAPEAVVPDGGDT